MEYIKKNKIITVIGIIVFLLIIKKTIKNNKKIISYDKFPLYPKLYKNFLDKKEINLLLDECKLFQKSTIVQNGKLVVNNFRTSKTCFINENSLVNKIIKDKIKNKFNLEDEIEKLQLTHYNSNEYYKPHHDYFYEEDLEGKNQRLKTIFVYLKCPDEGGETNFPFLNKTFSPNLGDAVIWTNCEKNNYGYKYNEWSLHEGTVVTRGEKIGLNIWLIDKLIRKK